MDNSEHVHGAWSTFIKLHMFSIVVFRTVSQSERVHILDSDLKFIIDRSLHIDHWQVQPFLQFQPLLYCSHHFSYIPCWVCWSQTHYHLIKFSPLLHLFKERLVKAETAFVTEDSPFASKTVSGHFWGISSLEVGKSHVWNADLLAFLYIPSRKQNISLW